MTKYGNTPLGKSVEEIEQESGNRVNSPLPGEVVRDREAAESLVVPAIPNANQTGTPAVMVNPDGLVEAGSGAGEMVSPDAPPDTQ